MEVKIRLITAQKDLHNRLLQVLLRSVVYCIEEQR
jgi:hypothetical protein